MNRFARFWLGARNAPTGTTGFRDFRCYVVMVLYLGAFVCFASDPFFRQDGLFVYRQGLAAILLAFLVTSTWNWELNWFGRSRGANLLLQMLQMLPATLFFARVAGRASAPPKAVPANFFEGVLAKARGLLEQLLQLIPDWLSSPFSNWRLTLLVMAVLAILSCRRQMLKSGALLLLLGGLAAATAINGAGTPFLNGLALFVIGLAFQFHRGDRSLFYAEFVRRILGSASLSEAAAAVLLRAAVLLDETGVLTERQLRRLVDDEYTPLGFSPEERAAVAADLAGRMLYEYRLVQLRQDPGEAVLVPAAGSSGDPLLLSMVRAPRMIFAAAVAVIWALLPIDLIPDAIPLVGALDDVVVALLAARIWRDSEDILPRKF